jgi:hypothetical protein
VRRVLTTALLGMCLAGLLAPAADRADEALPEPGTVRVDRVRGEIVLPAVVQHPRDKPCIDDWGERTQSFVGCRQAGGREARSADWFVFLVDAGIEQVHEGLVELGAKSRVHYSMAEAKKHSGLTPGTKPEDFLQGDPVVLSIFWKEGDRWVEKPYQAFAQERIRVNFREVIKPWTPSFVFHGSGAIYRAGTGCIASSCDSAAGLIADNRYPLDIPKPSLRFDWTQAPKEGTRVYVRIRPVCSR